MFEEKFHIYVHPYITLYLIVIIALLQANQELIFISSQIRVIFVRKHHNVHEPQEGCRARWEGRCTSDEKIHA